LEFRILLFVLSPDLIRDGCRMLEWRITEQRGQKAEETRLERDRNVGMAESVDFDNNTDIIQGGVTE
jgi:hypothetical protein